ncbi:hypothetical protein CJF31_00010650 [Rutstroemia sp. NJR-2017a BVV2]|nr:hypothetical protein CJF31_00010650 [Rutstroemia sp. NJR-2017a BVV2]
MLRFAARSTGIKELDGLIAAGKVVPLPVTVRGNGLHGILDPHLAAFTDDSTNRFNSRGEIKFAGGRENWFSE